jgi:hypothetical protein
VTDDQQEVIDWLVSPAAHDGEPVERIDTHSAVVVLAGVRAWKLKRAVRFDYLDFSTVERRRQMCEAEVRLNRRTAPSVYVGVVPVTRAADGRLRRGGAGNAIDWLVEMTRFPQDALLDRMAAAGALPLAVGVELAAAIAHFHAAAERRGDHGGQAAMAWVVNGNSDGFRTFGGFLGREPCDRLAAAALDAAARHGALLDSRRDAGFVRQCRGDIHLRNIVMLDGHPTLFDAIEFNDELACIDVYYDLAFLLMDLWRRRLTIHANQVLNGYLRHARDVDGLALLPLLLSCRAAVRAKTSATSAALQADASRTAELQTAAREYLTMAEMLLRPPRATLLAIGGLSGTGKSTLARELAPGIGAVPGAILIRSDEIRKELSGAAPTTRLAAPAYTAERSAQVYAEMLARAARVLATGHSVVVDAVHARPDDRAAVEEQARRSGARFAAIWLDAGADTLVARVAARRDDASDADAAVVRMQLAQPAGAIRWTRVDANGDAGAVARAAAALLTAQHISSTSS